MDKQAYAARLYVVENGERKFIGYADKCEIRPVEEFYDATYHHNGEKTTKRIKVSESTDYTFHLTKEAQKMDKAKDMVNHPPHYEREGAMESIDEMVLVFGKEVVRAFCLCNVWKYRYRAACKGGMEDMKKSDWYMQKYKELGGACDWRLRV